MFPCRNKFRFPVAVLLAILCCNFQEAESQVPESSAAANHGNRIRTSDDDDQPLRDFEAFIADSWVVTAASGRKMIHTWKWGPGKKSIERWTEGESASGDPWRELAVYYWHPQEKKIQFLGISPFDSGISEGTIEFDGRTATLNSTLSQKSRNRIMQTRWDIKNNNHYRETLLEKDSSGKLVELVAFDHHRLLQTSNPTFAPLPQIEIPKPWVGLNFLLGKPWSSRLENLNLPLHWSLTWNPVANFYFGRVHDNTEGNPQDRSHVYIYRGSDSDSLRFLALSANSDVFTGTIHLPKDGSIQLKVKRNSKLATEHFVSTMETISQGHLKQTIQTSEDSKTTDWMTLTHQR